MTHLRLVGLLGRARGRLVLLALLGVAVSATFTGQALVMAQIFAGVLGTADQEGLAGGPGLSGVREWLLLLVVLLLLRPLLVIGRELAATALMTSVKMRLRDELAVTLIKRSAVSGVAGRTGSDSSLVVDGVENLDPYLSRYLPQLAVTAVVFVAIGAGLVGIDPVSGAVVTSAAVLLALLPRGWDRTLRHRGADHWEAYEDLHAEFVDSMQGMTTLVTFGAADRRQTQLTVASERLLTRTLRQLRISLVESGLAGLALTAVPLLALVMVLSRRAEFGSVAVFAFVFLSIELVRPLRDLATLWHAGYLGTFSGAEIRRILPAPAATEGSSADRVLKQPGGRGRPDSTTPATARRQEPTVSVSVQAVHYTYPDAETTTLRKVTTAFGPGVTAVVGSSGSGKSTLALILAGLDAPGSGTVLVGGVTQSPANLRRTVALVPQDPVLFAGTVRHNLDPASLTRNESGLSVDDAAALTGIGTDDPTLTLDTEVGERGLLISGGQRQRVAIARGLLQNRSVLVLDEATSALDGRSEQRILDAVARRAAGRPVIMIAHRITAVANLQPAPGVPDTQVRVMAAGQVVEQGTPAELASIGGTYATLARAAGQPTGTLA